MSDITHKEFKRLAELVWLDEPICSSCAEKYGATWPTGHCATFSTYECGFCNQIKCCCAASDYDWHGEFKRYRSSREF